MSAQFRPAILMTLVLTIVTGLIYPLIVTGVASVVMPYRANGSLVMRNDQVLGSELIGQPFTQARYFQPRPSAAGDKGYDPTASGGSNLGPIDQRLIERVKTAAQQLQADNPQAPIPVDLVTTSGSGLDPHITPAAAAFQAPRVAAARRLPEARVRELAQRYTESRQFGFLGEPRVNVLQLNLALDELPSQ
jgi:potassium-transporting ATPase KdpC subunit